MLESYKIHYIIILFLILNKIENRFNEVYQYNINMINTINTYKYAQKYKQ